MNEEKQKINKESETILLSHPDEQAIWKEIIEIENNDLVYKFLKRSGSDYSYSDIARQLANMLNVNEEHLIDSSFLNVNDERLQRLSNGNWTLKEFIDLPLSETEQAHVPPQENMTTVEEPKRHSIHTRWHKYVIAALIIVIVIIWILLRR